MLDQFVQINSGGSFHGRQARQQHFRFLRSVLKNQQLQFSVQFPRQPSTATTFPVSSIRFEKPAITVLGAVSTSDKQSKLIPRFVDPAWVWKRADRRSSTGDGRGKTYFWSSSLSEASAAAALGERTWKDSRTPPLSGPGTGTSPSSSSDPSVTICCCFVSRCPEDTSNWSQPEFMSLSRNIS
jgi:hypothetical protein